MINKEEMYVCKACTLPCSIHVDCPLVQTWHTGTPTEEGWYLLAFVEDGRMIYDANRLKKGIWEYCLIGDIVKWQKIQDEPREEK